jgi:calcineurin-like phosphoesterase family protein
MIKIKTENNKLPDVWITSDTHYNHKNICRGVTNWRLPNGDVPEDQTRDFKNLDLMNDVIVNTINGLVGQDDILIHLGDWSFGGFEMIEEFRNRIFCKTIHLVLGNHDHHIERNRGDIQKLFTSVSHYNTLDLDGHKFRLMHYPIDSWDGLNKGYFHLHGHCHLPEHMRFGVGRRMDVGMDGHPEFRPYHIKREIIPLLSKRPIASNIGQDHHLDEMTGVVG